LFALKNPSNSDIRKAELISLRNVTHRKPIMADNLQKISIFVRSAIMNVVMLVGRAGRDPEMRYFESGRVKTTFSLAVNRPTKEKETDWFDIELWGRQAEVAGEYVRKGSLIGVEGRLDFSRWTDDSGVRHVKPYIHGSNLRLLGSKKDGMGDAGGGGGGAASADDFN
jgi:single-strand DNA-binding protein